MTSSIKTELHAYVWNAGEQPVEVFMPEGNDDTSAREDDRFQRYLMTQLEEKEFGKFVRVYPANAHMDAGELVMLYRAFTDEFRGRQIVSGMDETDLAASYEEHQRYCAQKVFSPAELYALRPASINPFVYHLLSVHMSNEINYYDIDTDKVEEAKRIEIRDIANIDYDGRRVWMLQTVWFDGKPVMVLTTSGRDADEYHDRWITDGQAFADMLTWLRSFLPADEASGFVKADAKIPAMTEFYGHTIHDYYDTERQEPRKK
jgi:hypothetical protein